MRLIKKGRRERKGGLESLHFLKAQFYHLYNGNAVSSIRLAVVIRRHGFLGNPNTKLVLQNVKEVKEQPNDAQLTTDRAKIGAQGSLTLKSVLSTPNYCTTNFLETMSLSLTVTML